MPILKQCRWQFWGHFDSLEQLFIEGGPIHFLLFHLSAAMASAQWRQRQHRADSGFFPAAEPRLGPVAAQSCQPRNQDQNQAVE